MITAKTLRDMLADIPDDTPIVLQQDDEGNGYRYMNGIDFEAAGQDGANLFNGSECIRASDLEHDPEFDPAEYSTLVAVAY